MPPADGDPDAADATVPGDGVPVALTVAVPDDEPGWLVLAEPQAVVSVMTVNITTSGLLIPEGAPTAYLPYRRREIT